MQIEGFGECLHTVPTTPARAPTAKLEAAQLSCAQPHSTVGALPHRDARLQDMRTVQTGGDTEITPGTGICRTVLHRLQLRSGAAGWIDLYAALEGPTCAATLLARKAHGDRSKPRAPY